MHKRILSLLLVLTLALSALFVGCQKDEAQLPDYPVSMYYLCRPMSYGQVDSVVAAEVVDVERWNGDYMQLMRRYLNGPTTPELVLPFGSDITVLGVSVTNGIATVTMSRNFSRLSGCDLTIAATCITKTLTQFEEIDAVRLRAQNAQLAGEEYLELQTDSIVLEDDGTAENIHVSLYFSDANSRYLLELVEPVRDVEAADLPTYVLHRLILGPDTEDSRPIIPEGTSLLSVEVSDDLCTVDFSREFLTNQPTAWQQERLTVFAIVNSLTSLDHINRVRILVEGRPLDQYLYLDLSQALRADESLIGPVREGLGEFDAVLCVPLENHSILFACPTRLQGRPTEDTLQSVLEALLTYQGANGHYNLIPAGITVNAFSNAGGSCTLDLSEDPLKNCETKEEMLLCLQSIILSMHQTEPITRVQITVNGQSLQDMYALDTTWLMPQNQYLQQ